MWIGDFVRCHTVVQLLKARWPDRPIDVLTPPLNAPLLDYMPGVRQGIVADLRHNRLDLFRHPQLASRLRAEAYGTALIMSRKWKAAWAPFIAGIPERVGFIGEARYVLLNDKRWGEHKLPRQIDQCAVLALPPDAPLPDTWPEPRLHVPLADTTAWKARRGLAGPRSIALAPGAVGPSKRWPASYYAEVAQALIAQGWIVWVVGGPNETPIAREIVTAAGPQAHDVTGHDLREGILALAAADFVLSNDSGLLHVAAAIGTPTAGIFGPTSPQLWAPLNPLAATIETHTEVSCRPCHEPTCRFGHHRCMRDISAAQVLDIITRVAVQHQHAATP
jgi:heptosyltransferase-2